MDTWGWVAWTVVLFFGLSLVAMEQRADKLEARVYALERVAQGTDQ